MPQHPLSQANLFYILMLPGRNLMLFFGKRKPGIPEQDAWRELVNNL